MAKSLREFLWCFDFRTADFVTHEKKVRKRVLSVAHLMLVCVCSDISPDCFFWRRLILVPIHMFPTFVFVATDKPVHVSNNCSNTCFGSCIYFVPPKQNQPTQQTASRTILSPVKRLGFLHLLYHGLVYRTH